MATTAQQTRVATQGTGSRSTFSIVPYIFILPHLTFFALFLGYPFFSGLYTSLFQYDVNRPANTKFLGLGNYAALFDSDSVRYQFFWNSLGNTVEFVLYSVPFLIIIPLLLAILLNTKTPGRNVFRAIYFAPWALSGAVVTLLWWWIFQNNGLMDYYLRELGIRPPAWLTTMPWAWVSIVVCTIWWTIGFNMIIILAALQDIPDFLYEAAALDGATGTQAFFRITLPMLRPVLLFIVTTSIIASFNLFIQPYIMTRGLPAQAAGGGATEPVMMRIYIEAFRDNRQGSAAAMSFVVASLMIAISYANFKIFRQRD